MYKVYIKYKFSNFRNKDSYLEDQVTIIIYQLSNLKISDDKSVYNQNLNKKPDNYNQKIKIPKQEFIEKPKKNLYNILKDIFYEEKIYIDDECEWFNDMVELCEFKNLQVALQQYRGIYPKNKYEKIKEKVLSNKELISYKLDDDATNKIKSFEIAIIGMIGSGKSSLINFFKAWSRDNNKFIMDFEPYQKQLKEEKVIIKTNNSQYELTFIEIPLFEKITNCIKKYNHIFILINGSIARIQETNIAYQISIINKIILKCNPLKTVLIKTNCENIKRRYNFSFPVNHSICIDNQLFTNDVSNKNEIYFKIQKNLINLLDSL
jgi:hypothetical protein